MAYNTVVKNKILSYADDNIFQVINNRSNVADPKNRGVNGKFVYRNDPWMKSNDYQSYPYIILRFPSIEKDKISVSGTTKDVLWTHRITVRTIMGGAVNNTTNNSAAITDMYSIIDDLHETFDSETIKSGLRPYNLYNLKLVTIDNDELIDSDGRHIFTTELELSYNTRMDVS